MQRTEALTGGVYANSGWLVPEPGCSTPSDIRSATGETEQEETSKLRPKEWHGRVVLSAGGWHRHKQRPWGRGQLGASKAQQGEGDGTETQTWPRTLCVEDFGHWRGRDHWQPSSQNFPWSYGSTVQEQGFLAASY